MGGPTGSGSDASAVACFVLAGGAGERLRPLTTSTPKPLLMYGGIYRLLDFTLSNLSNSGLSRAQVLSQYREADIGVYLRGYRNCSPREPTDFVHQPPDPGKRYRDTADAVAANLASVAPSAELILVVSADHIYRMDYRPLIERHREAGAGVTLAAFPVRPEDASRFGIIVSDSGGTVVDFVEKPKPASLPAGPGGVPLLANMGVYVFDRCVLENAVASPGGSEPALDFGRDVLPSLITRSRAQVVGFGLRNDVCPYWRDVGTVDAYLESNMDLLRGDLYGRLLGSRWPIRPSYGPAADESALRPGSSPWRGSIVASPHSPGTCAIESSVVGPGVTIEDDAGVFGSILLPGARIGRRARVRNAIVDAYTSVESGDEIGYSRSTDGRRFQISDSGVVVVASGKLERVVALNAMATGRRRSREGKGLKT